jgi:hypothetical protein
MAPPYAPSAQGGAGPGRSAADLTVHIAEGDVLGQEGLGCSARDRVGDIHPRGTGVGGWGCSHKAGSVFDEAAKLGADRGKGEGLIKGGALSELPLARSGSDEWDIHDLEKGRGCGGIGLNGNEA